MTFTQQELEQAYAQMRHERRLDYQHASQVATWLSTQIGAQLQPEPPYWNSKCDCPSPKALAYNLAFSYSEYSTSPKEAYDGLLKQGWPVKPVDIIGTSSFSFEVNLDQLPAAQAAGFSGKYGIFGHWQTSNW